MNGKRAKAWRNLMTAAINVAVRRGLIDLDPGVEVAQCVFDFRLEGLPTVVGISDSGYGEVAVRVAVIPTERGADLVRSFGSGLRAGAAYASGWFARRADGAARLQIPAFQCQPWLLPLIAAAEVESLGYAKRGRLM